VAWTRMFYYLSHTSSSPFSSGYFGNEVLWTVCPEALNFETPDPSLLSS
jgi:hypothetical protein